MITRCQILRCKVANYSAMRNMHHSCKFLVIGGGTGGCTMAAKLSRKFDNKPNDVIVIEPSEIHYYQPMFTLIGGGLKKIQSSRRFMGDVLPKNATWIKDSVTSFDPDSNRVETKKGDTVEYEVMIIAMGLQLHWSKIPGLVEALKDPDSQVCSIYSSETVQDVSKKMKKMKKGAALFTFPNSPVKCPGAPQKIAYIAEDFWRKENIREDVDVIYNTALPVIFGVKKYADALWGVCERRDIKVNLQTALVEINREKREAVFENLKNPGERVSHEYAFLHVCPPMGPPEVLKNHPMLTNEAGFLSVDSKTLKHTKFSNIYGIGDCTNTPNSKTMAAIASQAKVLHRNILDDLDGKPMRGAYNGYASCPLVTAPGKCILAEFDYNLQPLETFPVDQKNEMWLMYIMKKEFFPFLYWNLMLKGYWNGPEFMRKVLAVFKKSSSKY